MALTSAKLTFGSGNCDMDALGNRYFMFGGGKLKATWNTTTVPWSGHLTRCRRCLVRPTSNSGLISMYIRSRTASTPCTCCSRRATIFTARCSKRNCDSPAFTRGDRRGGVDVGRRHQHGRHPSGVCDLDPFNNRIFYQRVDELLVLNTQGQILNSIGHDPANTISPWANVQYHDLSTPPPPWSARFRRQHDSMGRHLRLDAFPFNLVNSVTFSGWSDDGLVGHHLTMERQRATWQPSKSTSTAYSAWRPGSAAQFCSNTRRGSGWPDDSSRHPLPRQRGVGHGVQPVRSMEGTFSGDVDPRNMAEEWGLNPGLYLTQNQWHAPPKSGSSNKGLLDTVSFRRTSTHAIELWTQFPWEDCDV